jgi:hypothetical protein
MPPIWRATFRRSCRAWRSRPLAAPAASNWQDCGDDDADLAAGLGGCCASRKRSTLRPTRVLRRKMGARVKPAYDVRRCGDAVYHDGGGEAPCATTAVGRRLPTFDVVRGLDPRIHRASKKRSTPRPARVLRRDEFCEGRWVRGSSPRMTFGGVEAPCASSRCRPTLTASRRGSAPPGRPGPRVCARPGGSQGPAAGPSAALPFRGCGRCGRGRGRGSGRRRRGCRDHRA